MISLDTNVLVRFLVEDDLEQLERARSRIQEEIDRGTRCYVSEIVLCELVWVLQRSYKVPRSEILVRLRGLLASRHLYFGSAERVSRALDAFEQGSGDFADYLIRDVSRDSGCSAVITFDRKLHRHDGFEAV